MTKLDLENLINEARSDRILLQRAFTHFNEIIQEKGYELTADERKTAQAEINRMLKEVVDETKASNEAKTSDSFAGERADVIKLTLSLLENSVEDARKAFRNLRLLSTATFATGLSLFVLSAVSGLILQRETFSLVFGGLGMLAIVTIFITKPKEEIQTGLSNLLQAETVFLNFYDQLHFWAPYSQNGSLDQRKQASQALQDATLFTLGALQKYVEPSRKKGETESA